MEDYKDKSESKFKNLKSNIEKLEDCQHVPKIKV
jgi:hypothetical protein